MSSEISCSIELSIKNVTSGPDPRWYGCKKEAGVSVFVENKL